VESERVSQLRQQMCSEDAKEQEIRNVHQQLTDLQVLILIDGCLNVYSTGIHLLLYAPSRNTLFYKKCCS